MSGCDELKDLMDPLQSTLLPLKVGEFSENINKVSVHISAINSALKSIGQESGSDPDKCREEVAVRTATLKASAGSSIKFARMNLDMAMAQALDKLIRRPKSANKVDEAKRKQSLGEWFDQLDDPATAMLEHFKSSSNPLDKWLVAGTWGHEYLKKRHINSGAYDREICGPMKCLDSDAMKIVLSYGRVSAAIDALEDNVSGMLEALQPEI